MVSKALVFLGAAGSGKDTAADAVRETVPGSRNLRFANSLKNVCCEIFGWDRGRLDTDLAYKEEAAFYDDGVACMVADSDGTPMTRRAIMQHIGTDLFRNQVRTDVWVRSATLYRKNYEMLMGDVPLWVITDARFANEVEILKTVFHKIQTVRLIREGAAQTEHTDHQSETEGATIPVDVELVIPDGRVDILQEVCKGIAYDFMTESVEEFQW